MYCLPIHTVPKPGTDTFQLINDQSDGEFSPNSMIDCDNIAGTCMGGIKSLGASLRTYHRRHGDHVQLIMHKSDIQGAYRNIPMAPMWQLKQIVAFEHRKHVDRSNCFRCRESYYSTLHLYLSFAGSPCMSKIFSISSATLITLLHKVSEYDFSGDMTKINMTKQNRHFVKVPLRYRRSECHFQGLLLPVHYF